VSTINVRNVGAIVKEGAPLGHLQGRSMSIRDDVGRMIGTVMANVDGTFQTSHGRVKKEDLGEYVLRILGHEAA